MFQYDVEMCDNDTFPILMSHDIPWISCHHAFIYIEFVACPGDWHVGRRYESLPQRSGS